jgi:hypothetical protein
MQYSGHKTARYFVGPKISGCIPISHELLHKPACLTPDSLGEGYQTSLKSKVVIYI